MSWSRRIKPGNSRRVSVPTIWSIKGHNRVAVFLWDLVCQGQARLTLQAQGVEGWWWKRTLCLRAFLYFRSSHKYPVSSTNNPLSLAISNGPFVLPSWGSFFLFFFLSSSFFFSYLITWYFSRSLEEVSSLELQAKLLGRFPDILQSNGEEEKRTSRVIAC